MLRSCGTKSGSRLVSEQAEEYFKRTTDLTTADQSKGKTIACLESTIPPRLMVYTWNTARFNGAKLNTYLVFTTASIASLFVATAILQKFQVFLRDIAPAAEQAAGIGRELASCFVLVNANQIFFSELHVDAAKGAISSGCYGHPLRRDSIALV